MHNLHVHVCVYAHACIVGMFHVSAFCYMSTCTKVYGRSEDAQFSCVTILGARGVLLGLVPSRGEAASTLVSAVLRTVPRQARNHVEHVALDKCSKHLVDMLSQHLPSLRGASLDVQHLSFKVDSHTKKTHAAQSYRPHFQINHGQV